MKVTANYLLWSFLQRYEVWSLLVIIVLIYRMENQRESELFEHIRTYFIIFENIWTHWNILEHIDISDGEMEMERESELFELTLIAGTPFLQLLHIWIKSFYIFFSDMKTFQTSRITDVLRVYIHAIHP